MNAKRIVNTDPSSPVPADTVAILETVIEERDSAMQKWGVQSHPDGTSEYDVRQVRRDLQRKAVDAQAENGTSNWYDILLEEVYEAGAEVDLVALDKELCQVMQVCLVWREDIRRRAHYLTTAAGAAARMVAHDARVQEALAAPLPSSARRPVTGAMSIAPGNGPAYGEGTFAQVNEVPYGPIESDGY